MHHSPHPKHVLLPASWKCEYLLSQRQWLKRFSVPGRKWKPLVSYIFFLCSLIFNYFFPKETATTAICLGLHCSSIHMQKRTIYLRARRLGCLSQKESPGHQQTSSAGMWHPVSAVVYSGHSSLISHTALPLSWCIYNDLTFPCHTWSNPFSWASFAQ